MSTSRKFRFGSFEVDLDNRELRKRGLRLRLQHKPFQILELLLQSPGQLVRRGELAQQLWPDLHVDFDRSLNTAVNSLRQALGDSPKNPRFIETQPGLGYRFVAPLQTIPHHREAAAAAPPPARISEECVKGRYFWNKLTEEDLHKSVAYLEAALAADARCAAAHAGLADAWCTFALLNMAAPPEAYARAKERVLAALALDRDLGEAHAALAGVKRWFEWDWAGADTEYRTALQLHPGSAAIHAAYGSYLAGIGQTEQALSSLRRARDLDGQSPLPDPGLAASLYMAGDYQGALEQSWSALVMEPQLASAQYALGLAYEQLGMLEEAQVELRNARTCAGDQPAVLAALAHACARAGQRSEACELLGQLENLSHGRYVSPYWHAIAYAGLGESAAALAALERARQERDVWLAWLKADPRFEAVRPEPRFAELLHGIGLG
jgi:DNA-binding winged helix-turn-helix (wHTH) protein/Tfp pilus assembly protein PilF